MGCASSSPLVAANGKIMEAAKGAATDAVHAGEEALNDVKSTVTETVTNVKEAVVGAVQNVGHGIESAFNGKKDTTDVNHDIKEVGVINSNDDPNNSKKPIATKMSSGALDQLSTVINTKSKEYQDEAEKLTDDLIKETNDVVHDTIDTTGKQVSKSINHVVNSAAANIALNASPVHSISSLETNSLEPEIEKAMSNGQKNPPTPKPTFSELEKLQSSLSSSIVNSGRSIIDVATAKFDTAVPKVGASNGQLLVTAETQPLAKTKKDHRKSRSNVNLCQEKILTEETAWEKLADQFVKVPIRRVRAYQGAAKSTVKRSSSVDNIFQYLDF